MALLGPSDLQSLGLPALWDLAEMKKVELADGTTFDAMIRDVQAALSMLNGELLTAAHYGDLVAVQDNVEVEYPVGVANGVDEATEYGTPTPKRGATTGHNIPIRPYDRALGWTMMYLRNARRNKLSADVRSMFTDARSHYQQKVLTRFFKMEAEIVGATAGASVPFADGAVADANYVPLDSTEGEAFLSSHDHYLRLTPYDAAAVATAVEHLQEHGHQSPFDMFASRADPT